MSLRRQLKQTGKLALKDRATWEEVSRQSLQPSSMLPPIAKPAVESIEPMKVAKQNKYIQNTPLRNDNLSKSINNEK